MILYDYCTYRVIKTISNYNDKKKRAGTFRSGPFQYFRLCQE